MRPGKACGQGGPGIVYALLVFYVPVHVVLDEGRGYKKYKKQLYQVVGGVFSEGTGATEFIIVVGEVGWANQKTAAK